MAATAVHFSLICAIFDFIYLTFKQPTWLEHFYEHVSNTSVTCGTVLWSRCVFNREEEGLQLPSAWQGWSQWGQDQVLSCLRWGEWPGPGCPGTHRGTRCQLLLPPFSLVPGAQGLCLGHPTGVCVLSYLPVLLGNEDFHSLFLFTE